MTEPIFIFSLPRSGSTLLQKILGSHEDIATTSEPWILLPFINSRNKRGTVAHYSHVSASQAKNDFINNMKGGEHSFNEISGIYFKQLYNRHCLNSEKYFLDKTPRYHYIIEDIIKLFPNCKMIFLFRNPLHIYNSILKTFCHNSFKNFHSYEDDLTKGFENLSKGYQKFQDRSISINYETLVDNTEFVVSKICQFLDIDYNSSLISSFFNTDLKGSMGDPSDSQKLKHIRSSSEFKLDSISNSYKKKIAHKILKQIKSQEFDIQGYDKDTISKELQGIPTHYTVSSIKDYIQYKSGELIKKHNLNLVLNTRTKKLNEGSYLN